MRTLNIRDLRTGPQGRLEMPRDAVRIDRRSRWGNPYAIGAPHPLWGPDGMSREAVLEAYAEWLDAMVASDPSFLEPLRGKDLACWCAPERCHGDIIIDALKETA